MTPDTFTRAASFAPSSYDAAAGTIEAIISTGAPVRRADARGAYQERLDLGAVDLAGLAGLPVLDGHRSAEARNVVGVIVSARRALEGIVALIRLSQAEDVRSTVVKIAEGILRGVSVGYAVQEWRETIVQGLREKTAVRWAIQETSFVPIPADPAAQVRHSPMEPETNSPAQGVAETRAAIRSIARAANLDAAWADAQIDGPCDVTVARAAAFDSMTSRPSPVIRAVSTGEGDPATVTRRATDALVHRASGAALPDDARPMVHMSLLDHARAAVERMGVSTRAMSPDETLYRAFHGTSDFPLLVSNAAGKIALESYTAAASPLKTLCRQRSLSNFKSSTAIRLGDTGRLEPLSEQGEFTATSRAERGETLSLGTFGRAMNLSRQLLIDDDLGLLGDMTAALGRAAAQTEADLLVANLLDNPNLSDGTPVFHASRGNIGTASAIDVAALSAARSAMRLRKGLDGVTLVSATPRYLVVGADRETEAEVALSEIYAATVDAANPFSGRLEILCEPRILDGSWFVFADPARLPTMQYAYLAGASGVQIQQTEAWDSLGTKFRAWLDFGTGWLDWRGAHKNAGL